MNTQPQRTRTQIIRLYKMEELLMRSHLGLTVIEISRNFCVDRKTIYRDLLLFEELGIPLYKEDGRYKIMGTYTIPSYREKIATI